MARTGANNRDSEPAELYPELAQYLTDRVSEFPRIPDHRKQALRELAGLVGKQRQADGEALITFICTHNSRRSHLAQVWAGMAVMWYGVTGVTTFSGGTEATAFNPRAVAALQRAGLKIIRLASGLNPKYEIRPGSQAPAQQAFSKVYDQDLNPQTGFLAVMTCSQADEACPVVAGSSGRIAITYEDPKAFDGMKQEAEMYDERCRQICCEMLYVFSRVAGHDS